MKYKILNGKVKDNHYTFSSGLSIISILLLVTQLPVLTAQQQSLYKHPDVMITIQVHLLLALPIQFGEDGDCASK